MTWHASSGMRAWLLQRVSAIYMAVFIGYGLIALAFAQDVSYGAWRAWLSHPAANAAVALFFFALFLHAWVGVRDVIMDYVHAVTARLVLLSAVAMGLVGMGLAVLRILFKVSMS